MGICYQAVIPTGNYLYRAVIPIGITPDISSLLLYKFYQRVYYYVDAEVPFPDSREKPARFVGIAENIGDAMTFLLITNLLLGVSLEVLKILKQQT